MLKLIKRSPRKDGQLHKEGSSTDVWIPRRSHEDNISWLGDPDINSKTESYITMFHETRQDDEDDEIEKLKK